ncbi:MAG: hypothetical protein ACT6RD_07495 [Brevundimonas sp.]|uniref:hypothetical protein n=1 Tax=Brevundimonas sp. TaxID=1871086 RepID=UPI0040335570
MTENGNDGTPASGEAKPDRVLSAFGWAFGLVAVAFGLGSFMAGGPRMGWGLLLAGILLLPPAGKVLGAAHPIFRRPMIPGLTAVAVGVLLLIINPFGRATSPTTSTGGDPAAKSTSVEKAGVAAGSRPAVDLVGQSDPMRPAQDALNRGEVTKAVTAFFSSAVPQERRTSPEGQQLRAAIQKAMDEGSGSTPSDRASEAFKAQQQALSGLATSAPETPEAIWQRVSAYEEVARVLSEHPAASFDPTTAAERTKLVAAASAKQRADFPVLRRAYGKIIGRAMWEQDVEVIVEGSGNRTIRFIAAMFAANRNIGSAQSGASQHLHKLRFGRSQYEWYRGSEGQVYSLEVPSDSAVGEWAAGDFTEVSL